MKDRISIKLAIGLLVGAFVLTSTIGPALAKEADLKQYKEHRQQVVKGLSLAPDKAKQFEEVDQKYAKQRQDVIANLNKAYNELKQEMAKSTPDEGKIKDLVGLITDDQDKLMNTFKSQRSDEMGLLTPKQQAQYLMGMRQWWEQHMGKQKKGK